jgi:hypothetical protein
MSDHRWPTALIALAVVAMLAWRAQAQGAVPAGTAPASYLPLVALATDTPAPTSTATPTASATPTATPVLPPPSFVSCATPPANPGSAPNYPVRIIAIDKGAETVTLQNVSAGVVYLDGWRMCSINGGQQHPIQGGMLPGQIVTYPNMGGPIWNNMESDPGALYTTDGRLASYLST